jgi:hypothetical protein
MIERGRCPRLALESFQSLPVLREFFRQELEGNKPTELGVFGLVDDAHAAATQLFENPVVRNAQTEHGGTHRWPRMLGSAFREVNEKAKDGSRSI